MRDKCARVRCAESPAETGLLWLQPLYYVRMSACLSRRWWGSGLWHWKGFARAQEADLKRLHEDGLKRDPFISRAVGPAAKIERMRVAALRLGSQGVPRSYDDHLLIIGDAAGHIDPLTGEGIHTAMMVRLP